MEYQYIEKGKKQLYSVYHEPTNLENDETGVVLCYPYGQEYIRCHKLYVNLANKLALKGFHVMRFDYFGTGDSSGEFTSITIDESLEDIGMAINELKEVCCVSKIILIGVRFGATLSLLYSQKYKANKLVLWNIIADGCSYLNDIAKDYKKWLSGSFTKEKKNGKNSTTSYGYLFSPELTKEIKKISLNKNDFICDASILLIDDERKFDLKHTVNISFENTVNKEFCLKREEEHEKSFVPLHEINKIIEWVK